MKRVLANTVNWFNKKYYKEQEETKEVNKKSKEEMQNELFWELLTILSEMEECDCLKDGKDEILLRQYYMDRSKGIEESKTTEDEKELNDLEKEVNDLENKIDELELKIRKEKEKPHKMVRVTQLLKKES